MPVTRPSILIYRALCVKWLRSQIHHPNIHVVLSALLATQRRNPEVMLLWRFVATNDEIANALAFVDAKERPAVSESINSEHRRSGSTEPVRCFNSLLANGCNENQRNFVIELLCNDLLKKGSCLFLSESWMLESLEVPWVRLVASLAGGKGEPSDHPSITYSRLPQELMQTLGKFVLKDESFVNSLSAQRVRMRWWNKLPHEGTNNIIKQAMDDPETLDRLRVEFTNPTLGVDQGGEFLLEIIHSPFSMNKSQHVTTHHIMYGLVPALLASSDIEAYNWDPHLNPVCLPRLQEFAEDVKLHPGRLILLLTKLVRADYHPLITLPQHALNLYHIV
ncbi:hypothetical protein CPB86DRAFT_814924 [Serendipita vermifera]|nr:hypothetical protein CPB86DRAFT_814924 [Serendipita vermifera]